MRRVAGETVEEMQSVKRRWPDQTAINWPPRSRDSWKSKSLPILWVDADREDILQELESVEVPEEYLAVLTMMIRCELYGRNVGQTEGTEKFFRREIRGKLIQLLRLGAWIDEPESSTLRNLNARLEKIDLGRRSDLNFSSKQSLGPQKYDQDRTRYHGKSQKFQNGGAEMDFEALYRDGSRDTRLEILSNRPWMKTLLVEKFGEP
jgi:hypothetical protein